METKGIGTPAVVAIIVILAIAGAGCYLVMNRGEAKFEVSSLTLSSTEAKVGEPVTASATVKNTGNATGTHRVALTIDGEEVEAKEVTLAPGETETVTFTMVTNTEGTFTVGVGGVSSTKSLEVNPLTPATFEVSNLVVNPSEVGVGKPVEISATVKNVGDLSGTHTLTLRINEVTEATKDVTLAGGATETVSFTVTKNESKTYDVSIDGLTDSFSVVSLSELLSPLSGHITQNSKLTLANSPYIVTNDLTIDEGVKLSIEPGVVVKFDGHYRLNVRGTLTAKGTKSSPITFTSNKTSPSVDDWSMIFLDGLNENTIFEYTNIEYAFAAICFGTNNTSPTIITNCNLRKNERGICGCKANSEISYNNISSNGGDTIGITGSCSIHHNNIISYAGPRAVWFSGGGTVNVNWNNISTTKTTTEYFSNNSTTDIDATNNWWGTTDTSVIDAHIMDYYDDSILGKVNYQSIATSEILDTGVQY